MVCGYSPCSQWVGYVIIFNSLSAAQVQTAITSDGTLGTTVNRDGTVVTILGGARPRQGSNLFHSFERFDVGSGDTVRFTGPQAGIANVISRVTGGHPSIIDGTLQSDIPGANLFLLNPSGMLLGPDARVDIQGAFYVSTADVLYLADGVRFPALPMTENTLTVASPVAFGFVTEAPAGIAIRSRNLNVPNGQAMFIAGGDIDIVGGSLTAPGGRIALASVASSGDVVFNAEGMAPFLQVGTVERLGEITLSQDASMDSNGDGGGTIVIRGGRLVIDNARVLADTYRRCLKSLMLGNPSYHQVSHGDVNHRLAALREELIILVQSPVFVQPTECPLHPPPFGQNHQPFHVVGGLDNLETNLARASKLPHPIDEWPRLGAIGPNTAQAGQLMTQKSQ